MPPNAAEHHVAGVRVLIDGLEFPPELRDMITEVRVKDSLSLPSTAVIRLTDPKGEKVDDDHFKIGKALEIKASAMGEQSTKTIFKGDIVAFEPDFAQEGVKLALRAYDKSHRMQRERKNRTFQDMSASDIVKKILAEHGVRPDVQSTRFVYKFMQQNGETDREFIARFERLYDYNLLVQDDKATFRKANGGSGAPVRLKYGESLMSFRPRVSSVQQVGTVTYRGWDPLKKAAIVGQGRVTETASQPGLAQKSLVGAFGSKAKVAVADRTLDNQEEAQAVARSAQTEMADAFVEAEGTTMGNPDVRAGCKVKIEGVGTKLSGEYVVSSADHVYRGTSGYKTSFAISGKSGRGLLDLMHRPEPRNWGRGFVVGMVTNVNDPQGMGRVKVKFPTLVDDQGQDIESFWARLVVPSAGNARGLLMMPRVNEEVVVAFENDDTRRPLIVGSVFNGKDKPGDALLARKDGSYAMLSDEQALMQTKKDMTFKSAENLVIEVTKDVKGKASGNYKIESSAATELKAGSTYKIEAGASMTIKGATISVEAQGSLNLKGATVNIEAQGPATLKGAMVNVQGSGVTNIKGGIVNLG